MATYNAAAVSDAVIAFQKPITLQQGRSLRDNPIAIAEGSSGAPLLHKVPLVISQTVITGSPSTVDIFFDPALYDDVIFSLANVLPDTDNQSLRLRLSDDGSTFATGASDYRHALSVNGNPSTPANGSFVVIADQTGNAGTEDGVSANISLFQPNLAQATGGLSHSHTVNATSSLSTLTINAFSRASSIPTLGARFYFGSGTMASGTITMFGVLKP